MKRDNLPITNGMIARVTRLDRFRSASFDWAGGEGGEKEREGGGKNWKKRGEKKNATKGERRFFGSCEIIKIVFPPR